MTEFNKKFYTVYNVSILKEKSNKSIYPEDELYKLYRILLSSRHLVTLERHTTEDELISELRVIFWNEQSYISWANENRKEYDRIVDIFNKINDTGVIQFERYTSVDNYVSQFPYTDYPSKNLLIDWVMIPFFKDYFINNILPIGNMNNYIGNGNFNSMSGIYGSRFLKDRTSNIERHHDMQYYIQQKTITPGFIAYSFDHILQVAMYDATWLYNRLSKLTNDVELFAEKYIESCEHSAVLVGHNSMGQALTIHTHRIPKNQKLTLTITIRLTFNDQGTNFKFYDPISNTDPDLLAYYSNSELLRKNLRKSQPKEFKIQARSSVLVFSASHIPHLVNYDNDVYLFYVYDNVTFKPGMLDKIQNQSQQTYFEDNIDGNRLYFFEL